MAAETDCIRIPLTRTYEHVYEGEISDPRALGPARWVLGICADGDESALVRMAPLMIRICSAGFVREPGKRALPGLPVMHLAVPPRQIPTREKTLYFGVSRTGTYWDQLKQTRRIGVYVPGEFRNPELEILVVMDT